MHLKILENFLNMAALLGGLRRIENDSQRDASLIGIEKRSPRDSVGASDGHPRDAFVVLYREPGADHTVGQLDCFLDTDANRVSFKVGEKTGLPAKQGVDSIGGDHHVGAHFLFAGMDADDLAVFLDQPVNQYSGSYGSAFRFDLTREPFVELGAHNRIRLRNVFGKPGIEVIDGRRSVLVQQHDLLADDFALQRRSLIHAGFDHFQGVGVETPARHILAARAVTALDQQHIFPCLGQDVGAGGTRRPRTYHDCVELIVRHLSSLLRYRRSQQRQHFIQVANDAVVRGFKNRSMLVVVDGRDDLRFASANHVLDLTGDAHGKIEFRLHGVPADADVAFNWEPVLVLRYRSRTGNFRL